MAETGGSIRVHRGEINSELCNQFRDLLPSAVIKQLGSKASQLSWAKSGAPAPPTAMPPDSVLLYADMDSTDGSEPDTVGAVSIYTRLAGSPQAQGLPLHVCKAAEITRMIVLDGFQRRGVAMKMIAAAEEVARSELDCSYLLVETGVLLDYAQRLYERAGYTRREPFGAYTDVDNRVFFEKWI